VVELLKIDRLSVSGWTEIIEKTHNSKDFHQYLYIQNLRPAICSGPYEICFVDEIAFVATMWLRTAKKLQT
jgi:hypothetical protein